MKERTYTIRVQDIAITVTRKRMKNMYLRISREDGSVRISAPHEMSEERILAFAGERIAWIAETSRNYQKEKEKRQMEGEPDEAEQQRRRQLLEEEVQRLVAKWEPVIGVQASGITIRRMKTRWGSCNVRTHHININLALYGKPPECLEYVVVHELVHILEPSHNHVFWGYMTQFYPDWKRVRGYLNQEIV